MTCKLNGLFSIGEDFDDEDLLGADWAVPSVPGPAAVSSSTLQAASVPHIETGRNGHQQTGGRSAASCDSSALRSSTHTTTEQTVAVGLRQLSSFSAQPLSLPPPPPAPTISNFVPNVVKQNSRVNTEQPPKPSKCQDDFDDWDVDLADLDSFDSQAGSSLHPCASAVNVTSSAKTLRPSAFARIETQPTTSLRGLSHTLQTHNPPSTPFVRPQNPRPPFMPAPPRAPGVSPHFSGASPVHSPISRTLIRPQQPQRQWATPGPSPQAPCGLFETVTPAPSPSPSSTLHALPLHTPVLTNRLVQLVSASSKLPKKRPRSEPHRPRTRRFPGPAGFLPQQPQGRSLDEIVVSVPVAPAHGAAARLPSQGSSSQTDEDDFSGGAWAAMKAEMGLDERNPSCFLHSYSIVMVLRKAVLKQLARNKVPNMAVLLKSIVHTHGDAKAVFKDMTGEIQGTVHRRLLEDRLDELKVGSVLLLKQVGVFSPSHRNHYLNVTSNNLLRIYAPNGLSLSTTQLPPIVLEPMSPSLARSRGVSREPVSRMHLMFDEEDDNEGQDGGRDPEVAGAGSSRGQGAAGNLSAQDSGWDADDLDDLLGELPEDTYSV